MKKRFLYYPPAVLALILTVWACQRNLEHTGNAADSAAATTAISEAKAFFEQQIVSTRSMEFIVNSDGVAQALSPGDFTPLWTSAGVTDQNTGEPSVEVPIDPSNFYMARYGQIDVPNDVSVHQKLVIDKRGPDTFHGYILSLIPTQEYYVRNKDVSRQFSDAADKGKFSGLAIYYSLLGELDRIEKYDRGTIVAQTVATDEEGIDRLTANIHIYGSTRTMWAMMTEEKPTDPPSIDNPESPTSCTLCGRDKCISVHGSCTEASIQTASANVKEVFRKVAYVTPVTKGGKQTYTLLRFMEEVKQNPGIMQAITVYWNYNGYPIHFDTEIVKGTASTVTPKTTDQSSVMCHFIYYPSSSNQFPTHRDVTLASQYSQYGNYQVLFSYVNGDLYAVSRSGGSISSLSSSQLSGNYWTSTSVLGQAMSQYQTNKFSGLTNTRAKYCVSLSYLLKANNVGMRVLVRTYHDDMVELFDSRFTTYGTIVNNSADRPAQCEWGVADI